MVAGLALVAAALPAWAHHAFASEFDAKKPVKFTATVTKMEWINPHAWMHVAVKKPDGTVENWMIEAGSPNSLFRRGINKDTVKVGMQVVVDGYQARDGSRRANGRDVTLPEGRKLFLGSQTTPGAPPETSGGCRAGAVRGPPRARRAASSGPARFRRRAAKEDSQCAGRGH
jgi:hypothetical protein